MMCVFRLAGDDYVGKDNLGKKTLAYAELDY